MLPLDLPPAENDIDRFISPASGKNGWAQSVRHNFSDSMSAACRGALADLGLSRGRVAFDDMRFGFQLGWDGVEVVDGYDPMMYARAVKTEHEVTMLKRSTALNQAAIEKSIASWQRGMTWREFNHVYHCAAVGLGGFVRDPGAMIWGHPQGVDSTVMLQTGLEDFEVSQGLHVMFDCHGTLDLYCWDGGKTWVVDGEPVGSARTYAAATSEAAAAVMEAMRPGVRISELQALGRDLPIPEVYGPDEGNVLLVGWGSTQGSLREATERARKAGDSISALTIRHVNPLPGGLENIFSGFTHVYVVENNAAGLYGYGQLCALLRSRFCDPKIEGINKTDGLTWRVKDVLARVQAKLEEK
jgi:hypothetical protein